MKTIIRKKGDLYASEWLHNKGCTVRASKDTILQLGANEKPILNYKDCDVFCVYGIYIVNFRTKYGWLLQDKTKTGIKRLIDTQWLPQDDSRA